MINLWKKKLVEGASSAFDKESKKKDINENDEKLDNLYSQIGKLQIEKEFLKKKISANIRDRTKLIEKDIKMLTITEQCNLLGISRTAYYYKGKRNINKKDIELSKEIINTLEKIPFYGYRKISVALKNSGATPKKVRRIMKKFGLRAIYPKKNLSKQEKSHKKYPYLIKNKEIFLPNQVWASDITYIKLKGGHVYLVAIIDIFSRKILSWRLSNSLDTGFVVAALEEAIQIFGIPAIFNTDQGSQFTSEKFISVLEKHKIQISMDSVGRALDNIYMERCWRSLKYEDIFLNNYDCMGDLKLGVKRYFKFYNTERFHQSLGYATPDEIYYSAFGGNKDIMVA